MLLFLEHHKKTISFAIALFVFVELTYLNLTRYWGLSMPTGDLATMAQAMWNALRGSPLVYTVKKGVPASRLLEHAEVIYFLLAPLMKLDPSATLLLIVEIGIFSSAAIPVFRLGEKFGKQGLWAVVFYVFYPVAQTAALAEFHSDTLAMALLLWAVDAMERRKWHWFGIWVTLALACKIYIVVPVVFLGGFLWLQGQRKASMATWAAAIVWAIAMVGVKFWIAPRFHATGEGALQHYIAFRYSGILTSLQTTLSLRLEHGIIALLPFLPWLPATALAYLSPIVLLLLPILTTSIGTYNYFYHHYAIVVPFIMYAVLDTSSRLQTRSPLLWQILRWLSVGLVVAGHLVLVVWMWFVFTLPSRPLLGGKPLERGRTLVKWANALIPKQAPLLASSNLVGFFSTRPWVAETFGSEVAPIEGKIQGAQFVVLDLLQEGASYFSPATQRKVLSSLLNGNVSWSVWDSRDGVIILKKGAPNTPLPWSLQRVENWGNQDCKGIVFPPSPSQSEPAALLCAQLSKSTKGEKRTVHAEFVWQVVNEKTFHDSMAITTIGTWIPQGERFVHFPLWASFWKSTSKRGDVVVERLTWKIHEPPGCYPIKTAWYATRSTTYPLTNRTNLLGEPKHLGALKITRQSIEWVEGCH